MSDNKWVIKSATKRRKLHDRLYEIGDFLLKKYNPCGIKDGTCNGKFDTEFCCDDCKYKTKDGCRVKCLWCKLWLCNAVTKYDSHLYKQFSILTTLAGMNYLLHSRASRSYALRMSTDRNIKSIRRHGDY